MTYFCFEFYFQIKIGLCKTSQHSQEIEFEGQPNISSIAFHSRLSFRPKQNLSQFVQQQRKSITIDIKNQNELNNNKF